MTFSVGTDSETNIMVCTGPIVTLFPEPSYRGTLEEPWIGRERVRILASKGEDWRHYLQFPGQIPPALQRLHREIPNIDAPF